jgi:hypothetical protein
MADPKLLDGVWETCSAPGTGNVSLLGAKIGYLSFSGAGAVNNDKVFYAIRDQSGSNEEWGVGTWVTGPTLNRTAGNVLGGTSGVGTLVNFNAGTQDVFCSMMLGAFDQWVHRTNTFANLAALQAGRLALPSDGFCAYRDDGTHLVPWGPLFPFADPQLQTFAWVNQGNATIDTTKGGVYLANLTPAASYSWNIRKKAAPATPYKITVAFMPVFDVLNGGSTGAAYFCLTFRESSSGKLAMFFVRMYVNQSAVGTVYVASRKFTNETTYSSDYTVNPYLVIGECPVWFLRIADDGTNRVLSFSTDGQVGVGITGDMALGMTLLDWKES